MRGKTIILDSKNVSNVLHKLFKISSATPNKNDKKMKTPIYLSKPEMISLILYYQAPTKYPTHYFQTVTLLQRHLEKKKKKNISNDVFFYLLGSINPFYLSIYKSVTMAPCFITNSSNVV